jgi:hypothetical protein
MPKYVLHYRCITVTPVHIEADSIEEATNMAVEKGTWLDKEEFASSLSLDEVGVNTFEAGFLVNEFTDELTDENEIDYHLVNA